MITLNPAAVHCAVPSRSLWVARCAASDFELEHFLHLYALNRGVLLTPFHSMALMCPATTESDIDTHTKLFAEATRELTSWIDPSVCSGRRPRRTLFDVP